MMTGYLWIAILISAICTLLLRALPFLVFRDGRTMPEWLKKLGDVLPSAIMAVLIVYCLKDGIIREEWRLVPELIAVAVVVGSYLWKHNTLVSILLGTACYMVLVNGVFH